MARPVRRRWTIVAVLAVLAGACGNAADYLLLERFFAASRLRDRTALAGFALVAFEPHVNGTVSSFSLAGTTAEHPAVGTPDRLQAVAAISLADPLERPVSPGETLALTSREVMIDATVRRPDGRATLERMVVEIQRVAVGGQSPRKGTWVVTAFR